MMPLQDLIQQDAVEEAAESDGEHNAAPPLDYDATTAVVARDRVRA